ncbi:hypothetical protein [Streptomonospora salina]|uniref:DUF4162 domain-containing protein n=1 Tax=Streptomonospora salina TaxID=104205 RepID=A0A841ED29_9ACTN|nr:hypothetical protein [Streptomonospora salina]MBB6000896.1 hypothetical protein [Streptomonospora salina]
MPARTPAQAPRRWAAHPVRRCRAAGIRLRGTRVPRPTLDDIFLSLTGRSLREDRD